MAELIILDNVARQYRASLAMLGQAVHVCPDSIWLDEAYPSRFWHIAYHALFYTHLYLQPSEADCRPWVKHRQDCQYLGPRPCAPNEAPKIQTPYTKTDVMEHHEICSGEVERRVPTLDLEAPSGFPGLPFNKRELQVYNIRHIQHHTGQLADRLRTQAGDRTPRVRPNTPKPVTPLAQGNDPHLRRGGRLDPYRLFRLESRCYVTHHGGRPLAWKVGTRHWR